LVVQPIIGYLSDRTWGRLGRRRPYFLIGALLATAALVVMPNSPYLWVAAGMLWILDASINVSMKPFRALFGGHSINALALGGLLLVLAGLATLRVDDREDRD
jgi:maltose/moltooligosaccharide transporter